MQRRIAEKILFIYFLKGITSNKMNFNSMKFHLSLFSTATSVLNPDPHRFGCSGSGSVGTGNADPEP